MSATAQVVLSELSAQESAGAVKNKANFIAAQTKNSKDAEAHRMSAAALSNLQDQINALNKAFRTLAGITPASASISGAAGGDLSGTYPNPSVVALQGNAVKNVAPSNGDLLTWVTADGEWEPQSASVAVGAVKIDYHTLSGTLTIHASVMPAPANGALIVALTMASGAVQPTWAASDFSLAPGAISILVGTKTNVLFCADGAGKWMMCAPPVTGR